MWKICEIQNNNLITNSEKNTFEYNFGLSFLFITTFGQSLFVAFA